ncbi:hypothetical protein LSM04_009618 [Trypanosoma melophagium]|uniref:uncharacterized protein n=1 Tax=Trypanosoma melophagium TaxID=715481 RepID=UPI00351A8415|nr:hypothetical protein LSM04_009618 [Trypanosoma melophagium]
MNQSEFNSVEAELREIEEEFASGQMNAFGTATTKENFVRELRKIADIETQVFYKACGLLSASSSEDYLMRAMMFTAAESPGANGSNSSNNNNNNNNNATGNNSEDGSTIAGGTRTTRSDTTNNNNKNANANNKSANYGKYTNRDPDGTFGKESFAELPSPTREDETLLTSQRAGTGPAGAGSPLQDDGPPVWSSDAGFADRPFQDVARHFKMLENEFTAIGEHLRQISTHVLQLNDIAERVRTNTPNHGL